MVNKMGFNVTGQEVASGVYDPATMFIVVGVIILVGLIGGILYNLLR
jgi:hypothetical protein